MQPSKIGDRGGMNPDEKRHTAQFQTIAFASLRKEDMLHKHRRNFRVKHFIQMIAKLTKPYNHATHLTTDFYFVLF